MSTPRGDSILGQGVQQPQVRAVGGLSFPAPGAACPTPTPSAANGHLALGRQVVTAANSWPEGWAPASPCATTGEGGVWLDPWGAGPGDSCSGYV